MPRRRQRLDEQAIERFVGGVVRRKGREVDLLVPPREQPEIDLQPFSEFRWDRNSRVPRPPVEAFTKCLPAHVAMLHTLLNRLMYAPTTATAAGVTPGMRSA